MEINGVPLHPLVVHAAVVFGPLAALAALVHVVVPSWRDRLRWPLAAAAAAAGAAVVAAYLTGRSFVGSRPELAPLVVTHRARAWRLLWVTLAFTVVALVVVWRHDLTGTPRRALDALLGLLALGVLVLVAMTGDAGARAVWSR